MFYAVLALLVPGKKETSKHSGAIALFDRDFVKQGPSTTMNLTYHMFLWFGVIFVLVIVVQVLMKDAPYFSIPADGHRERH